MQILLAMMVMWILCAVLTVTDVIPDDKDHPYYYSRTDSKLNIITNTPWFQITYPGWYRHQSFLSRLLLEVCLQIACVREGRGVYRSELFTPV